MLVEGNYNIDINDATPGKTPLKMAKDKGHTAIVWFLDSHGARVWIPILRNALILLTDPKPRSNNKQTNTLKIMYKISNFHP